MSLQALALEFGERADTSQDGALLDSAAATADSTFYEITIATVDQPKLLSRLSDAMVSCSADIRVHCQNSTTATPVHFISRSQRTKTCGLHGTCRIDPIETANDPVENFVQSAAQNKGGPGVNLRLCV